ncbi:MAG: hypothetical protein GVY26_05025 [Bacteroidetes bacterium]|nr:hypothetical protein [Bacteroidota bacterium]
MMTSSHNQAVEGVRFQSLEAFLASKGPQKQYFRVDPTRENLITGSRGTRLHIPPYALVSTTAQYAKGPVDIELVELFQPSEMILANRPSTSEDRLLEMGGQLAVFAYQQGKPLTLGRPLWVELPIWSQAHNPLAMQLFEHSKPTMRAFSAQTNSDWQPIKGVKVGLQRLNGVKYHVFSIDTLNWYHCSHFLPSKKRKVMVSVYPVGVRALDEQLAFLAFRNRNTVARMYWSGSHFSAFNIPAQSSAEVIVLGLKQGQLFLGRNRFRKAKQKTLNVHLRHCSQMDIIDALQDL